MSMSAADFSQSVVAPAGPQALSIHGLWLLMLWTSTAVFALVIIAVFFALARGIRNRSRESTATPSERSLSRAVASAIAVTAVILIGLLVASVWTGRVVGAPQVSNAVSVAVVGHQWWWEIQYEEAVPSRQVLTANELHIPVGRPVIVKVTSRDVIHSFWVPNLQGKRDLIPGYMTAISLQADQPGIYRGQCAEFCGLGHARMALDVVAEPDADFERWLAGMRQLAPEPSDTTARRGRDVFMHARCVGCHAIRGTEAAGQAGPDLTHIGSRSTLGAGTLSNSRAHLAAWIRDPQGPKQGNQMPPNPLGGDELDALVTYLETLR
jgi:cytochrome c oxidase subunit 2